MNRTIFCRDIKITDKGFGVKASMDAGRISGAVLMSRNIQRPEKYVLKCETIKKKNTSEIKVQADLQVMDLYEGDWDLFLLDTEGKYLPVILSPQIRMRLLLGNYQAGIGKNHILFPMASTDHMLTFRCRRCSAYDGRAVAVRENLVYVFYTLTRPLWSRKKIWVIFEKYSTEAQDNGYYFFKYCMENLPQEEKKHIYYILDKKAPMWRHMEKYGKNVVPFMSTRHMLYMLAARIYVASDARSHGFAWKPKPNIISRESSKRPILFLQHGVTALKRVDRLFGKHGSTPMTYFNVTSEFEQKIVTDHFGYPAENVPILGFARWDVLKNKEQADKKNILFMPTWRPWLEEQSDQVFEESEYCRRYRSILENRQLQEILSAGHVKIIFHIHPKLKEFLKAFQTENSNVELIEQGTRPLNELIMECSMLLTDYSSVSWDVYYLGKPVVFYQFDYDLYMQANGSYLDMKKELFGDRYITEEEVIRGLEEYVQNDFREKEKYGSLRQEYFAYNDQNNCKRILEFLRSKGY